MIYDEEVRPSEGEYPKDLKEATREIFEKATAEGFASSSYDITEEDVDFVKRYADTINTWSVFRVHDFAKTMADEMHDEDGNLRSFEEWLQATEDVQSHYNRTWLEAEYNTATLRAEAAANWKQFEKDKDVAPNLKWMPTTSAEPREEHAVFWRAGLTLPVGDEFWNEHHPGDLWNCKCWLMQTNGEATPPDEMPKEKDMPDPAPGLKTNPGARGEMFDRSHPYYPKPASCLWLGIAKKSSKKAKCPGDCNACPYAPK